MTAPSFKGVRPPAVAGLFYPESPDACRQMAQQLLADAPRHPAEAPGGLGGLVPHAGWICSGQVAAETLVHLATGPAPDMVVVFGAAHTASSRAGAALDSHAAWSLPTGQVLLPQAIETELARAGHGFVIDSRLHQREHAIEVQIPFIQLLWPGVAILPVVVEPDQDAPEVGRQAARIISGVAGRPIFLASSDLTHYGANYGLMPAGIGRHAMEWATSNDQRLLNLLCDLKAGEVVDEARSHLNACGAGAIAAMLAACLEMGAKSARLLRHTSSYQTLHRVQPQSGDMSVGYAAAVVQ